MAFPLEFLLTQAFRYTLMPKDKKKHAKKKDELSGDILDMANLSLKKFRKVTKQIGKLSTGQKVVGGLALLAAGLTYLAQQQTDAPATGDDDAATSAVDLSAPRKRKKAASPDGE
ncbi:hypothetical protein GKZ68_16230 [Hymenobacter sp. BRD128]|uniref:hypothetical protein n=1 Tax=Hymenobacter sp. BRD128 TaxID=2675878 RepID=UPI00156388E3|nr:hypothetical protein [Hymenobacter sp. BRD128]QKG58031.1 hypothetical protein GKZ68_16230 [Hymenobacter sp. BRD128]